MNIDLTKAREERAKVRAEADAIMRRVERQNRDVNPDEDKALSGLKERLDILDEDIRVAEDHQERIATLDTFFGANPGLKRILGGGNDQGVVYGARDMFREAMQMRALTGDATTGSYTVKKEYSDRIWPALAARSVVMNIPGVRVVETDANTLYMARNDALPTAGWQTAEGSAFATGEGTYAQIALVPKTVGVMGTYSRQMLEDSVSAESVLDSLVRAVAVKMDEGFLVGNGSGAPVGLYNTSNINSVVAGTAVATDLSFYISALTTQLADESDITGWVLTPTLYTDLVAIKRGGSSDLTPLLGGQSPVAGAPADTLLGRPIFISSQMTAKYALAVNGPEVVIARRRDIEVMVDPYTNAHLGQTRVIVSARVDIATHGAAVCKIGPLAP